MWPIGLWLGVLLLFVVVRRVIRRNQGLEIRRRELLVIQAGLEALAEEGEIFREEEPYQILREHIEALLPVVKGWSLRRLIQTIGSTRFHREGESLLVNTPEIRHLVIHLGTCTCNIIYDRCLYVRVMFLSKVMEDPRLLICHIISQNDRAPR